MPETVRPLWAINIHDWDYKPLEYLYLSKLKNKTKLLPIYENKKVWPVFFGVMSVISYDFLNKVQETYDIFSLTKYIDERKKRMALERVFGVCCQSLLPENTKLTGVVIPDGMSQDWNSTFSDYMTKSIPNQCSLSLIKVWSGR